MQSILNTPEIDALRLRVNAFTRKKELEFAKQTGLSSTYSPFFGRWSAFLHRIERFERAGYRFAAHVERVDYALASPVTRFFMLEVA